MPFLHWKERLVLLPGQLLSAGILCPCRIQQVCRIQFLCGIPWICGFQNLFPSKYTINSGSFTIISHIFHLKTCPSRAIMRVRKRIIHLSLELEVKPMNLAGVSMSASGLSTSSTQNAVGVAMLSKSLASDKQMAASTVGMIAQAPAPSLDPNVGKHFDMSV